MRDNASLSLSDDDVATCMALLARGSASFHAASRLLPRRMRAPTAVVYAFCRVSDDAIDAKGSTRAALDALHARLDRVYAGAPRADAVERAFTKVVHSFEIPRALPDALLDGFLWDLEGRRYETFSDVCAYGVRVASSVGLMMTCLMGSRTRPVLARAAELGVAMQLTNIARDVGEDARAGRIYLPLKWLEESGTDPAAFLADPQPTHGIRRVTRRLLTRADELYESAEPGIAWLPSDCRVSIMAARTIYAAIGDVVASRGFDSVTTRASTTPTAKLALLGRAATRVALATKTTLSRRVLPEAAFLIDAAAL